jgi:hypothetical protein
MKLDAAVVMGKRRATSLSPERRKEIAVNAAKARWHGHVRKPKRSKAFNLPS